MLFQTTAITHDFFTLATNIWLKIELALTKTFQMQEHPMTHILVVDDSSTESHAFRIMLEKKGFTVSFANNGLEGLTKAKALKPDLILMDVVMPQVNGFQATRKLKRDPETAGIPVIIISAKNQETDRVWGLRQGAKGYLSKPVSKEELFNKINMLINP
ncbi:hypothetical protein NOC27_3228 [Nitrosococcus oceani AFC27]|nr:hypothetical protein NOC27_3228 [Nitrosococcus oceani AFC27]